MPTITRQIVNPETLSPAARQALTDELHTTHAEIFDGVPRQEFARYVVDSSADRTRIEVYRSADRVVGYFAVHTFVRVVDGQRWVIIRAETGKLPAFRRDAMGALMIAEVLRICVRYPRARKAFLGCFVHPSAYVALGHVAPTIYPHWSQPTPAKIDGLLHAFAGVFGLDAVPDAAHAGVRKVGWITREDDETRASWARRSCEMSRFFMAQNPGYTRGEGLLVFIPISAAVLVEGTGRHVERTIQRRLRNGRRARTRRMLVRTAALRGINRIAPR